MPTVVTLAGSSYNIPNYGDTGWAQGLGNLSSFLVAIPNVVLQTTGGTFTLSSDVNFGSTYGVISAYYKSSAANIATAGVLRLALGDEIAWGTSNLALSVSGTNLLWNGSTIQTAANLPIVQYAEYYTAGTPSGNYTGSLTLVNMVNSYSTNGVNLMVFINGLLQIVGLHYTETSTTSVTFTSALNTGDLVNFRWTVI